MRLPRLKYLAPLFILGALFSCATMPIQGVQKGVVYQYDMLLTVDGITRVGMLVAPKASAHSVALKANGDLDLFIFETCHRYRTTENIKTGWWIFADKRNLSFTYTPSPAIETDGYCPARFSGLTEKNGQSSWGFVDFEDTQTKLPAKMQCDGAPPFSSNGVTVCQSKAGTMQKISFPEKVIVTPAQGCEIELDPGQKEFLFTMPKGFCVFNFTEVAPLEKQRRHRLTTHGFEQTILHGRN